MSPIYLVARRDFLAYVGAWGFWLSLITAPLVIAMLLFVPVLLARAEPPRALVVLADRPADAALVTQRFSENARRAARGEVEDYLRNAAPHAAEAALVAYDAAPNGAAALNAARGVVQRDAPRVSQDFPSPTPRYVVVPAPAPDIEGVKPYLRGERTLQQGEMLYGALRIRRDAAGAPTIEYWSTNLSHKEPSDIAWGAVRLAQQREALAARGLGPEEADALAGFDPKIVQFDPRPNAGASAVGLRQRAPSFAALALSFILWSVVFSVANMLLSGVIEEKSNKILDTLLTSVTPLEMLIGKLLGVAAVSATLFLFWGAIGGVLLNAAATRAGDSIVGQIASAFLDPRLLTAFAVGFVFGYLMYGAIFLALGALCESMQEAQTLLGPVALVLAMPMMLIAPALDNPNSPIIQGASWVPLFTPFLLLIRAPSGLGWVEIIGMGAVMLVCAIVLLMLAARIFRAGIVDQLSLSSLFGRKKQMAD